MSSDGAWQAATGSTRLAQGFQSDPSGRYLKSVRVRIRNANSANNSATAGDMSLSLWSASGGAPSQKIADLITSQSFVAWADGPATFTATTDIDLGASATQYFVVFQSTGTVSWKCDTTAPTPAGASASFIRKTSGDSGATWTDVTSGNCSGKHFNMTVVATDISPAPTSSSSTTTTTTTTTTTAPPPTQAPSTSASPTSPPDIIATPTSAEVPTASATTVATIQTTTSSPSRTKPTLRSTTSTSPAGAASTVSTTTTSTSPATTTTPPTTMPTESISSTSPPAPSTTLPPASVDVSAGTGGPSAGNLYGNLEVSSLEIVATPGISRSEVKVRVSARGLVPGSVIVARVYSEPITIVEDVAPQTGVYDVERPLPDTLGPGMHTVVLDTVTVSGPRRSLGTVTLDGDLRVASASPAAAVSTDVEPGSRRVARAASSGKAVYDPQAQPAATAGLAMSAAAVLSLIAGGATAVSQSATRRRETRGKVAGFVSKKLKSTGRSGDAWGDKSATWRLPLTSRTDRLSRDIPVVVGRWSATLPRIAVDGSWMRAWSGSLFVVAWAASFVAGVSTGAAGPGVLAPSAGIVLILSCVGLLDAGAGFSAWVGVVIGALVFGNISDAYDVRTLMGLAALFVGLSPLAHVIRPLRRNFGDRGDIVERIFDYAIAPVFVAFAASSMLKALNGLSGLELVSPATVEKSVYVFWAACIVRFACEDLIHRFYPERMSTVQPGKLTSPGKALSLLGILPRSAIFLFVAVPFFGWTWQTVLSAVFLAIPLVLKPFEDDLPNIAGVHRWLPRGLFRFLCLLVFGMWLAQLLVPAGDVEALRRAAVWLLVPGLVVGVAEMFGRFGGDWNNVRVKWSLGFLVWLGAVGLVSGAVTLF